MEVVFVTTNTHKFQEVSSVLEEYPVTLTHQNQEYEENHDVGLEEIVRTAVVRLAEELQQPVVIEDTGLYFEAYEGFPGALPKFVINTIGIRGVFKLLDGEVRGAYFKTVAGFCEPGQQPVLFDGVMRGVITDKEYNKEKDVMPYDRIFVPEGKDVVISSMTIKEKNEFSQRAQAFRKFGEYMRSK